MSEDTNDIEEPQGEWVRGIRIRPYIEGKGPSFQLHLYQCGYGEGIYDSHKAVVGPVLLQENVDGTKVLLWDCKTRSKSLATVPWAPEHDKSMAMVLDYLCSRPGDLDSDHFKEDTPDIKEFRRRHGEALGIYACDPEEGGERQNEDGTYGEDHVTWPDGWEEIDEQGNPLEKEGDDVSQ